jgi:hypothetical protein
MKPEDLMQEVRDNKSHFLVTLLDFCDQIKNQARDSFYRSRIDTIITDLTDMRDKLVNAGDASKYATEIEITIKDLIKLKQETQIEMKIDGRSELIDYHKGLTECIKKRVHCDVNNYDRRMRLVLQLPFEKHRIEPLKD